MKSGQALSDRSVSHVDPAVHQVMLVGDVARVAAIRDGAVEEEAAESGRREALYELVAVLVRNGRDSVQSEERDSRKRMRGQTQIGGVAEDVDLVGLPLLRRDRVHARKSRGLGDGYARRTRPV